MRVGPTCRVALGALPLVYLFGGVPIAAQVSGHARHGATEADDPQPEPDGEEFDDVEEEFPWRHYALVPEPERERLLARVEATGRVCSDDPEARPRLDVAVRLGPGRQLLAVRTTCYLSYQPLVHFLVAMDDRIRPASFVTPWRAPTRTTRMPGNTQTPASWFRASREAWLFEHEGRLRLRAVDCGRTVCDVGVIDTYEWQRGRFVQLTRKERDASFLVRDSYTGSGEVEWPLTHPRNRRCVPRLELQGDEGVLSSVSVRGVVHHVPFAVDGARCEGTAWDTIRCARNVEYQAVGMEGAWVVFRVEGWEGPVREVARVPRGCSLAD